jgi:tripartite-type tricarboxylate transporter receptor subunit TctC
MSGTPADRAYATALQNLERSKARRVMLRALVTLFIALMVGSIAKGEEFPARVVTIVSPYQAGGTNDIIARILAQKLAERWAKSVVVENRPGANGGIGVIAVAHAAPDGHTLLAVASSALTINPLLYAKLQYDVWRDLAPITRTGIVANVLVVNPSVEAKSVEQLIALARVKPGGLSYASQGSGSNGHVTGELFKQRANIDMLHVPYKGSAPAVQDLVGGQTQVMFDNLPTVLPLIRSDRLRALAVTTGYRIPQLPETPTIAESGLPGFDTSAWFALLAPQATPSAIRAQLETAAVAVLTAPDTRDRLDAAGVGVAADGASVLEASIKRDTEMWQGVINTADIKVE